MKKSTIITTIAMIVVVVVALSTATYAWFTTSQATYANVEITISADQNLSVLLNGENAFADNTLVAFTAQDFTTDANGAADGNGIRASIWVPNQTTVLTQKPSHATSFEECYLSGAASEFAAATINTSTNKAVVSESTAMAPTLIHVKNNKVGTQAVTLTIYIGFADDLPSKYAASGVAVYLADSSGLVACTKYCLPSDVVGTGSAMSIGSFDTTASVTAQNSTKVFSDSSSKNHTASIDTETTVASLDEQLKAKLTGCDKYYTLSVPLSNYINGAEKNYLTYVWLDGGYLNDNAKGSTIAIAYAFTGEQVTE